MLHIESWQYKHEPTCFSFGSSHPVLARISAAVLKRVSLATFPFSIVARALDHRPLSGSCPSNPSSSPLTLTP
ncbi:hypothetical protein Mapa_002199 [Marchantia paleacea]|nr:hypothetical protein Mapa_002199 [Marchantia paleacea]